MCNTHKRIRGCKPNPELTTTTFRDYVIGFCKNQEHQRIEKCTECGGSSLCESATIEVSCVRGVFVNAVDRIEYRAQNGFSCVLPHVTGYGDV